MTTTVIEKIKAKTLAIEIKRSKIPREPVDITTCSSLAEALDKLAAGSTRDDFLGKYGLGFEGYNWDTVNADFLLTCSPERIHVVTQFNRMKSIPVQNRSHGRTNGLERKLMAYFFKYVCPSDIARKFNVSVSTVYLHIKRVSTPV
jgi:hypothetical protein